MSLAELLEIRSGVTAVIGGGGKTALLRTLGEELSRGGARVLLCASAKIFPFAGLTNLADPTEAALAEALRACGLVCAGTPVPGTGKFAAPGIPMTRLAELADYVLAEADGSAGRPMKAHASHEPVIPPEANQTICVVGASGRLRRRFTVRRCTPASRNCRRRRRLRRQQRRRCCGLRPCTTEFMSIRRRPRRPWQAPPRWQSSWIARCWRDL